MIRIILAGLLLACACAQAQVSVTHTFTANTPALAGEVNQNFQDLVDAVNALQATVDTLQTTVDAQSSEISTLQGTVSAQAATIQALESGLAGVEANTVLQLDGYLSLSSLVDPSYAPDVVEYPVALFEGINVQVVDGSGTTDGAPGGTGNLIVGYNEPLFDNVRGFPVAPAFLEFCANPEFGDQTSCEDNGYFWGGNQRRGSHNLILGSGNSYSQYGALIAGRLNIVSGFWGTITGGIINTVRGTEAHVSGGTSNQAIGSWSSISAGASGIASGDWAAISGGSNNTASGLNAAVSGGRLNQAAGQRSSVSGGDQNRAIGDQSSVSGGLERSAANPYEWVGGDLFVDPDG